METVGNNIDPEMAFVRDCFFASEGERELNREINAKPSLNPMQQEIDFACDGKPEQYYKLAMSLITDIETRGNYTEDQMARMEVTINYCLGKIVDLHPEQVQEYCPDDDSEFCQ